MTNVFVLFTYDGANEFVEGVFQTLHGARKAALERVHFWETDFNASFSHIEPYRWFCTNGYSLEAYIYEMQLGE